MVYEGVDRPKHMDTTIPDRIRRKYFYGYHSADGLPPFDKAQFEATMRERGYRYFAIDMLVRGSDQDIIHRTKGSVSAGLLFSSFPTMLRLMNCDSQPGYLTRAWGEILPKITWPYFISYATWGLTVGILSDVMKTESENIHGIAGMIAGTLYGQYSANFKGLRGTFFWGALSYLQKFGYDHGLFPNQFEPIPRRHEFFFEDFRKK